MAWVILNTAGIIRRLIQSYRHPALKSLPGNHGRAPEASFLSPLGAGSRFDEPGFLAGILHQGKSVLEKGMATAACALACFFKLED